VVNHKLDPQATLSLTINKQILQAKLVVLEPTGA
jgi:hypothetical protein